MPRAPQPMLPLEFTPWQPPRPVARFEDQAVRASTLAGRIARAVATTLRESRIGREDIAACMSEFLGKRVTSNMLNAYASQAREDQAISVERFVALLHATQDRRLLELMAEPFGWSVVDRAQVALISLSAVREQQDELRRAADALKRQARQGGAL